MQWKPIMSSFLYLKQPLASLLISTFCILCVCPHPYQAIFPRARKFTQFASFSPKENENGYLVEFFQSKTKTVKSPNRLMQTPRYYVKSSHGLFSKFSLHVTISTLIRASALTFVFTCIVYMCFFFLISTLLADFNGSGREILLFAISGEWYCITTLNCLITLPIRLN